MKYEIEHMEHGGWVIEAPSMLEAVVTCLGEDRYAFQERIGPRRVTFAIHDRQGDLIDHWLVSPLQEEAPA
jgi:hypothetical protein